MSLAGAPTEIISDDPKHYLISMMFLFCNDLKKQEQNKQRT